MESVVILLKWPEKLDSQDPKRFETNARTLRYQALGRACKEKKITSLMVAHHGDDQAETILMRLSNNRLRSGLQGMQSVEWIPECEGIYGIYHSGHTPLHHLGEYLPFPVEQGGIQILRPLLDFPKSRLIATCENKNVNWAEDQTNQIRTLTSRNAIRHIYKNYQLPQALSIESLVEVSLQMQKRIDSHRTYARALLDQCLMRFDIQFGYLVIRFPPYPALLSRPIETDSDRSEAKNNAYCLIERIADMVTPRAKVPVGQVAPAVGRIYPELADEETESADEVMSGRKNYSVCKVWWRFQDKPSPFDDSSDVSIDLSRPNSREWILARQPLDGFEKKHQQICVIDPPSETVLRGTHSSPPEDACPLFDGRFWIRLRSNTDDSLLLRMFDKEDMRHLPPPQRSIKEALTFSLRASEKVQPKHFIQAALSLLPSFDTRFTLPAVFRQNSTTGEETLVGFPTLDVHINGVGSPQSICEWSVQYKKIDFGNRTAADIIVPGITHKRIAAEVRKLIRQRRNIARRSVVR